MNHIDLSFQATAFNGLPCVRILLDDQLLIDHKFQQENWRYEIDLPQGPGSYRLVIERYGKTAEHWSAEQDQTVEITGITVDGIPVPHYVLDKHSRFEFDGQSHPGSRFFGPNGTWTFEFVSPMLTFILDQKILHEAQYNQDYEYPWSYRLGPDSVNNIVSSIDQALERVKNL